MNKDREAICKIISKMLDNPDKSGIYPTSTAYTELEHYIESVRSDEIYDVRGEREKCLDALRQIYAEYGEDARIAEICDPLISDLSCSV